MCPGLSQSQTHSALHDQWMAAMHSRTKPGDIVPARVNIHNTLVLGIKTTESQRQSIRHRSAQGHFSITTTNILPKRDAPFKADFIILTRLWHRANHQKGMRNIDLDIASFCFPSRCLCHSTRRYRHHFSSAGVRHHEMGDSI